MSRLERGSKGNCVHFSEGVLSGLKKPFEAHPALLNTEQTELFARGELQCQSGRIVGLHLSTDEVDQMDAHLEGEGDGSHPRERVGLLARGLAGARELPSVIPVTALR